MYTIEKATGDVKLNNFTVFIKDTDDMQAVEFWEERLEKLGQPYAIAFREREGRVYYSLFTNTKKAGSPFRVKK